MDASTIFLLALVLACPLMMLLMHRGHRDRGSPPEHGAHRAEGGSPLDELRRRREEIDAEIARREEIESGETTARR